MGSKSNYHTVYLLIHQNSLSLDETMVDSDILKNDVDDRLLLMMERYMGRKDHFRLKRLKLFDVSEGSYCALLAVVVSKSRTGKSLKQPKNICLPRNFSFLPKHCFKAQYCFYVT